MATRSAADVFADHLRWRAEGNLEADLSLNYADDVVLLCGQGAFVGVEQVRKSAERLGLQLPNAHFIYVSRQIHGDFAFLGWRAESDRFHVDDGADSYDIRDGRMRMQTILYRSRSPE